MSYPDAVNPSKVGEYEALAFAGGGFVWDDVLEYRVWCYPGRGAKDVADGSDYFYTFGKFDEAVMASHEIAGATEPLALVLQREYIDELADGTYRHVKQERVTEWPTQFLDRPRRDEGTIPEFFGVDAPPNRLEILRGEAPGNELSAAGPGQLAAPPAADPSQC